MATRRGITVIGVDAAYTSKWGGEHWMKPYKSRLPTRPQCRGTTPRRLRSADVASDWRFGDGQQVSAADSGPLLALRWLGRGVIRELHGCVAVPAHRYGELQPCRSIGEHAHPAAKTVRTAREQDLLPLVKSGTVIP